MRARLSLCLRAVIGVLVAFGLAGVPRASAQDPKCNEECKTTDIVVHLQEKDGKCGMLDFENSHGVAAPGTWVTWVVLNGCNSKKKVTIGDFKTKEGPEPNWDCRFPKSTEEKVNPGEWDAITCQIKADVEEGKKAVWTYSIGVDGPGGDPEIEVRGPGRSDGPPCCKPKKGKKKNP